MTERDRPVTRSPTKRYLGDGVYADVAEFDEQTLKLTAEDGVVAYATIYFDANVLAELKKFIERNKL